MSPPTYRRIVDRLCRVATHLDAGPLPLKSAMNVEEQMRTFARNLVVVIGFTWLAAAAYASGPGGIEYGINRPGSDYKSLDLVTDSPALCQSECSLDPQCKAWTFVKSGVQGPKAKCWLKSSVPAAVTDNNTVSGVKPVSAAGAGGAGGTVEANTNRFGGDYANYKLKKSAKPSTCRKLCNAAVTCKAWTFVKAGIQGSTPVCWLKNTVPPATPDSCCTSGVK
jgi:hypothetical protein